MGTKSARIREIPYNYTSFSDKEIVTRYLGESSWETLNELRESRRTGISARMLFEVLGDLWVADRNPFLEDDLLENGDRLRALVRAMNHRLDQIEKRAQHNEKAMALANQARDVVKNFEKRFPKIKRLRKQTLQRLGKITKKDNIAFHGHARVAHVTDASDWRIEYPFVVITPDKEEEIPEIVRICRELKLTIIPRGGGTGYTGGAVPIYRETAVINTEKLQHIGAVEPRENEYGKFAAVRVGSGVVTRRLADHAEKNGYVFAVDPTSIDASTIGGNIAMNAGGKKAVQWGCTADNLLSYRVVMADSHIVEVVRDKHNLGKLHDNPSTSFTIHHFASDGKTKIREDELLNIPSATFRKPGLGKDVTNKELGGLPAIQKEGCDGIITSAEFVLHIVPEHKRTICLEFFGPNMRSAVSTITEIKDYLEKNPAVLLTGLEHLDERYIIAVKYATKSTRHAEKPRMLLLADVAGNNEKLVSEAVENVVQMVKKADAEGFVAESPEARLNFWKDRSRTAAIARHTNAFKLNEDIVIPLNRLADYSEEIERINIEYSIKNKLRILESTLEYLDGPMPEARKTGEYLESSEDLAILEDKKKAARNHFLDIKTRWMKFLESFDRPAEEISSLLKESTREKIKKDDRVLDMLLRRDLRISYRDAVEQPIKAIFTGGEYENTRKKLDSIHAGIRSSRIFVALHMHAGDGNIHTNIPVNSNDYEMMHEVNRIVDRIMEITIKLGGVITGEHGVGLTKFQYLEPEIIERFVGYKKRVDPENVFNKGKLLPGSGLDNAYTPSFRLVQQEAIILEESDLGKLNSEIKHCLRCGKCKPVCNTHIPRANLDYSPRNKILSTGLIVEAFLYEEQTRRGVSQRHFAELADVADHCTVCHKCFSPCPVNIDFGDVSILMRNILKKQGKKRVNPGTWLALKYLSLTDSASIHTMRSLIFRPGIFAQRLGTRIYTTLAPQKKNEIPPATTGKMELKTQITHSIKKQIPSIPPDPLRKILGIEDGNHVAIIRNPEKTNSESEAVFYFPGCSAERLYTDIGLAVLALLYDAGVQTVLPPEYLCCGYPQHSYGDIETSRKITMKNRVLFHRMANTLNYMDIRTVLVSCGTCMDQLMTYEFENIFNDCRLLDIHEYLEEKEIRAENLTKTKYLYHDPCHTPIKTKKPQGVVENLMKQKVIASDRCCGEAGTMSVSRPDISTQVRFRKQEEMQKGIHALTGHSKSQKNEVKMLTSCPACLQGLGRYTRETGVNAVFLAQELIELRDGKNWKKKFIKRLKENGIEKVLL